MKTIEELLKNLARPEVLEFGLVTNRLPSVNIGGKFEPVDDEAPTTDKLLHMLATMGGTRHVESLSEKPVQWTTRLDGVGVIAVAAIMRKDVVQARFTVARRDPGRAAASPPRSDVANGPPPSGRGPVAATKTSDGARPSTPQLQTRPASSGGQLAARPQPQSSGQIAVVKPAVSNSRLAAQAPRGGVWQDDDEVTVQTISPPVTGTPGGGSAEPRPKPARRPENVEEKTTPARVEPTAQERAVHGGGRRISTPTSVDAVDTNEARKSVPVPAANPIATQGAPSGSVTSAVMAKSGAVAQAPGPAASPAAVVSSGPQTPAYGSAAVAAPTRGASPPGAGLPAPSPAAGVAAAPSAGAGVSAPSQSASVALASAASSGIAASALPSPAAGVATAHPAPLPLAPQSPPAASAHVSPAAGVATAHPAPLPLAPQSLPAASAHVSPAAGVATAAQQPSIAASAARSASSSRSPAEAGSEADKERPRIDTGATLDSFLAMASAARASDIHVVAGRPVLLRVATDLLPRTQPLAVEHVDKIVRDIVPARLREALEAQGSCDFAVEHPQYGRFRVNVSRQRTGFKMSMRVVPRELPTLASLGLPEALAGAVKHRQGIVLVTGPAGHGKTATLAALVDLVNRESARHVLTIEDPIEYVHPRKRGAVSHREVGLHARSFTRALEAGLREDVDVIVVGEVRDLETTRVALAAAEAGHLVLATMNARGAASAIARLIDVFPAASQPRVRAVVAGALRMIVGQRLVPSSDRSKVHLACELVPASIALHGLVRDGKMDQVPALLQRGKALGIVRLDESLGELVRGGKVTVEIAKQSADSVPDLEALVARASQASQPSASRKI